MEHWQRARTKSCGSSDIAGRPCILGLDIANKIDLTAAVAALFRGGDEGKEVYTVFAKTWLPEARVEGQPPMRNGSTAGWLTQTPGETTDFSMIEVASAMLPAASTSRPDL